LLPYKCAGTFDNSQNYRCQPIAELLQLLNQWSKCSAAQPLGEEAVTKGGSSLIRGEDSTL
jgi:hypothetical protein